MSHGAGVARVARMDRSVWREQQRSMRLALRERGEGRPSAPAPAERAAICALVSVIVVFRNAEAVIGGCIDHLMEQDHPNFEVIAVDDASSDRSAEIVASQARVRLVRSGRHRGCPSARNTGLRHASGGIVAFIDADGYAAPDWLTRLTAVLERDRSIGAVASTVFLAANPMVLNGAGGTVNRQGWAGDLGMGESWESAQIASQALYAMGCGMAFRRTSIERVGAFDEAMLNYYDDVDYGIRVWRAGLRVAVVPDAWIDHDFTTARGDDSERQRLCERHRMRVVLKHSPLGELPRWGREEVRALRGAAPAQRRLKLAAAGWNAVRCAGVAASRWRLRGARSAPEGLRDGSWGDAFPAGLPLLSIPDPARAKADLRMSDPGSSAQLLYGWFPAEGDAARTYRWAGPRAAALLQLPRSAGRVHLDYTHVPLDTGGVDVHIREAGAAAPEASWRRHLRWQFAARSVENHPLALGPGDYEVVFLAREAFSQPPGDLRSLGLAVAEVSFHDGFDLPGDGLDMSAEHVDGQLVDGWYEAERSEEGHVYRWAGARAAAVIRLSQPARALSVTYRLPPRSSAGLRLEVGPLHSHGPGVTMEEIGWVDGEWHTHRCAVDIPAGDHLLSFTSGGTWSNPDGRDPALWPEGRELGFAIASVAAA